MTMSITTTGLSDLHKLVERTKTLQRPLHVAMRAVGHFWTGYIQERLIGSSPSAPGDYPGLRTGMLRSSIMTSNVSWSQVTISSNVEYAGYLQFGTSRMAPRPFLFRDGINAELEAEFANIIETHINRYLTR